MSGRLPRKYACRVERISGTQTYATGVEDIATFNATAIDVGGMALSNGIIIKRSGLYVVQGQGFWDANAVGYRQVRLTTAAAEWGRSAAQPNTTAGVATIMPVSGLALLNAGDTVSLACVQTSGGNLNQVGTALGRGLIFLSVVEL